MTSNRNESKSNNNGNSKSNNNGNGLMEVVFILDRSGSMCGLEADTIGGFNNMLKKQKETSDKVVWSTVLFDNRHEVIHNRVPVDEVLPLTEDEYYVRGTTALLDAVGRAISHIARCHRDAVKGQAPEKTLFVITTDGMENSSMEYSYRKVKEMIEHEKEKYGWEFLFLGANIDAVGVAGRMGISADRSATYVNDSVGIQKNYEAFTTAMCSMSVGAIDVTGLDDVRRDFRARGGRKGDRRSDRRDKKDR